MAITVVCGPPGAGKTTWVAQQAATRDLVIDLDSVAGTHDRTSRQTHEAWQELQRLEASAASHDGDVWVIRCAPTLEQRRELRQRLNADRVVVLATPADEAKRRTTDRPAIWPVLIDGWWRDYRPDPADEVIRPDTGPTYPTRENHAMTDTTDAPADAPTDAPSDTDAPDLSKEVEKWQALARKHEERAKANAAAAKELEQVKQQSMSEIEKAVAQAKAEGRAEGLKESSSRVAAAALKAAATGRFEVTPELLEGVNLAAFVDDDGEVDEAKVAKFVDGIAPKPDEDPEPRFPDLGQGARGSKPLNGDPLLRDLKNVLGVR